jgi:hypothetical protein
MSLAGSSRPLHAACLQGPMSTLSPAMGATCGRREREAGAGNGRSNPFHVPTFATVEGTLVHATPSTFAGRRKNMSLGRSEASVAGLVPMQAFSPTTTGVLWKKEEGNVVSVREAHALGAPMPKKHRHVSRTRPSLGPETRARQSALNSGVGNHSEVSRQSRYRGRENLRKQEEPAPGPRLDGRSAARRVSPLRGQLRRSCVMRKKRKVVMATVPARKRETRAQRPYVVCSCRNRQAASWPRISSYAALQKGWR